MKVIVTLIAILSFAAAHGETAAPPQERVAAEFGDWSKICVPDGSAEGSSGAEGSATAEGSCQITQTVNRSDLNSRLFDTAIGYVPEQADPVIFLTAPLGMYLPRGITIELTEETLLRVVVQRCTAQGCLAVTTLEKPFVEAMKGATQGRFIFGSAADEDIAVPLSLKGFSEALASIAPPAS